MKTTHFFTKLFLLLVIISQRVYENGGKSFNCSEKESEAEIIQDYASVKLVLLGIVFSLEEIYEKISEKKGYHHHSMKTDVIPIDLYINSWVDKKEKNYIIETISNAAMARIF